MSMSPPPSYPDPLMEVSQQPTTMASQPESESQQPSTMTSQPESESRHMQGPFKPVEAQFLENYLEAYLTFDTSDSKKGTKKTWVKNNVFSKYTQHFKSEEPGGPNLESLEKVMARWFTNRALSHRKTPTRPHHATSTAKKPRMKGAEQVFGDAHAEEIRMETEAEMRTRRTPEAGENLNVWRTIRNTKFNGLDDSEKLAWEEKAKQYNESIKEPPSKEEIFKNQRNVANNSGVALQELIGWDHGQHGNVIYSVDVAWMKQDGNIAHHHMTIGGPKMNGRHLTADIPGGAGTHKERVVAWAKDQLQEQVKEISVPSDDDNDAEPQQSSIEESFETHATPSEQAKELSVPSDDRSGAEPQQSSIKKPFIPVEIVYAEDGTPMLPSIDNLDLVEKNALVQLLTAFLSAAWSDLIIEHAQPENDMADVPWTTLASFVDANVVPLEQNLCPDQMSISELRTFYGLVGAAQGGKTPGLAPFRFLVPPLASSQDLNAMHSEDGINQVLSDEDEEPATESGLALDANTYVSPNKRAIDEVETDNDDREQPESELQPPKKKKRASKNLKAAPKTTKSNRGTSSGAKKAAKKAQATQSTEESGRPKRERKIAVRTGVMDLNGNETLAR